MPSPEREPRSGAELLALSDEELARVINGATEMQTGNWSYPKACLEFLAKLDVGRVGESVRHNHTDGECDLIFVHWPTRRTFRLNDNYYNFECFVPVARWALEQQG